MIQTLDVISINIWHIIISLLNLLILFLILKKLLFKPVKKMFAERQAKVDNIYDKANEANEQAQANKQAYEEKLSHSKEEATNILRNAREMAEQSSNEILQEAHNKADLAVKKANAEIARERKLLTKLRTKYPKYPLILQNMLLVERLTKKIILSLSMTL